MSETITLVRIAHEMPYADRVRTTNRADGLTFEFWDATGLHGQYQIGNPIARPPDWTIGAAKIGGVWHWVVDAPQTSLLSPQ